MTQNVQMHLIEADVEFYSEANTEAPKSGAMHVLVYDVANEAFVMAELPEDALLKSGMDAIAEAAETAGQDLPQSANDTIFGALGVTPADAENNLGIMELPGMKALPDGNDWSTQAFDSDDAIEGATYMALAGGGLVVFGIVVATLGAVAAPATGGSSAVVGAEAGALLAKSGVTLIGAAGTTAKIAGSLKKSEIKEGKSDNEMPQEGDPAHGKIDTDFVDSGFGEKDPMDVDELILKDEGSDTVVFIEVDIEAEEDDLEGVILTDPDHHYANIDLSGLPKLDVTYGRVDPPETNEGEAPVLPEDTGPSDAFVFV